MVAERKRDERACWEKGKWGGEGAERGGTELILEPISQVRHHGLGSSHANARDSLVFISSLTNSPVLTKTLLS